jgi:hypothetical protein
LVGWLDWGSSSEVNNVCIDAEPLVREITSGGIERALFSAGGKARAVAETFAVKE